MKFKLSSEPELLMWTETRRCLIEDENGKQRSIMIVESPNNVAVSVWNGDEETWETDTTGEIARWVENDMAVEELKFNFELREQEQMAIENEKQD